MNQQKSIERKEYRTGNSPTYVSSNRSPQSRQNITTVYKSSNLQPSVYVQGRKSEIREASNLTISPTVSFGGVGSTVKVSRSFTLKNTDKYEGQINSKGQFHGQGKYTFNRQKMQYVGSFKDGKQHGRGQLYKLVGGSYNSNQINSHLLYDGEWLNGKKNGQGKYYYENGMTHYYTGSWLDDQRHGVKGTYINPTYEYTGEWKYGKMSGKGILKNKKTGSVFDGIFQNNQFEKGVVNYANKDQYRGLFNDGNREDNQGRYIYRNKRNIPKLQDESSKTYYQKSVQSLQSSQSQNHQSPDKTSNTYQKQYVGGWKKGQKHGKCVVNYHNGDCSRYAYQRNSLPATLQSTYQWVDGSEFNGWLKRDNYGNYTYDRGTFKKANGQIVQV